MSTADEIRLIELIHHPHPSDWDEACGLFTKLVQLNYEHLIRFSTRVKMNHANHADIEDAVCESIEDAMSYLRSHFNGKEKVFIFGMEGQVQSFRRWVELILWNGKWGLLEDTIKSNHHQSISDDEDQVSQIPDTSASENLDHVFKAISEAVSQLRTDQKWAMTLHYGFINYDENDTRWILNHALNVGYSLSDAKRMQRRARDAKLTSSNKWSHMNIAKTMDCSARHVGDLLEMAERKLRKSIKLKDALDDMKQRDLSNHTADPIYYLQRHQHQVSKKTEINSTWVFTPNQINAYIEKYPGRFDAMVQPEELLV